MITELALMEKIRPYLGKIALGLGLVLLFVGSLVTSWWMGKLDERADNRAELSKYYEKKAELLEREAAVKVKEQAEVTATVTKQDAKLSGAIGKLNRAIDNAGIKPDCDLTEEELQAFGSIGEAVE